MVCTHSRKVSCNSHIYTYMYVYTTWCVPTAGRLAVVCDATHLDCTYSIYMYNYTQVLQRTCIHVLVHVLNYNFRFLCLKHSNVYVCTCMYMCIYMYIHTCRTTQQVGSIQRKNVQNMDSCFGLLALIIGRVTAPFLPGHWEPTRHPDCTKHTCRCRCDCSCIPTCMYMYTSTHLHVRTCVHVHM